MSELGAIDLGISHPVYPNASGVAVAQGQSAPPEAPSIRVLVVDDSRANQALFRAQFGARYVLEGAECGADALRHLESNQTDIVIVDLRLPDINGLDLCRTIRASSRFSNLPIMVVTNSGDADTRQASLDAGADDFVGRPYDRQDLNARLCLLGRLSRLLRSAHPDTTTPAQGDMAQVSIKSLVAALTGNRLELLEGREYQSLRDAATIDWSCEIAASGDVARARGDCFGRLRQSGEPSERAFDLALCLTEAGTNAFKHAGRGWLGMSQQARRTQVFVEDTGQGIDFSSWCQMEASTVRGAAPRPLLGLGYTIMLTLLDKVYLSTSHTGTRLVLEIGREDAQG